MSGGVLLVLVWLLLQKHVLGRQRAHLTLQPLVLRYRPFELVDFLFAVDPRLPVGSHLSIQAFRKFDLLACVIE
jgi:hypothetical protein